MRTLLSVLILMTVPLAGCLDGGGPSEYTVTITEAPDTATTGEAFTFSWKVDGPEGPIAHVGSHWADFSVADPGPPSDYGNNSGVQSDVDVPGEFSAQVTFPESGTYYIRGHAIADGDNWWSAEATIQVEDDLPPPVGGDDKTVDVTLLEVPDRVNAGDPFMVSWNLSGSPGEIPHTGTHWADFSVEDPGPPSDYGNTSTPDDQTIRVPGDYSATVTIDEPGTIHLRAHAIREGENYWSDEVTIEVVAAGEPIVHEVEARDVALQFDPDNITVAVGDIVNWTNVGQFPHTVTFEMLNGTEDNELADLGPGESVSWQFMEPGTYQYRCTYHSGSYETGMIGTIVVEAEDGSDGAS